MREMMDRKICAEVSCPPQTFTLHSIWAGNGEAGWISKAEAQNLCSPALLCSLRLFFIFDVP